MSLILRCDGLWQFDDNNFTTFPVATTTLVASQRDYSFNTAHLYIERVEVLTKNGIWHFLNPIDITQLSVPVDEYMKDDGLPNEYDKSGSSLQLFPAPASGAVTLAAGLKVYFKRTADLFTSAQQTTGTKEPGFASPFHVLLAYKSALPYALSYKKDRVPLLLQMIKDKENELVEFYARREQDRPKTLMPSGITFR